MKSDNQASREEDSLEEALSPLVNRLIDKNYESSQEKISKQMAPLIGAAIRQQIKSKKDDIVDALYPVIGNMISRYVTKMFEEMLTNINNKIQNGLSFTTLKRKFTAKIKGVSESELLLSENAVANIRALLLIHKETGIVLAHVENPDYPVSEPEMLASMMTAIRSFVNDWVEKNSDNNELGEIEYGDKKIIIESSGYSYLAVIVQGNANKPIYDKIRETLENIVFNHGDEIKEFDGMLENFGNMTIYKEISQLLSSGNAKENVNRKLHPLFFILPIFIIILTVFYTYKSYLQEELLNKINTKLYKTPSLTSFRLSANIYNNGIVILHGEVPFAYHKQLAQTTLEDIQEIKEIKNEIVIVNTLQDPVQISSNIAYLLKGFNTQQGVNVTYKFDYNTLTLQGNVWNNSLKQDLLKQLREISFIKKIEDKIEILPPKIDTKIYFEKGLTHLNTTSQTKLISLVTLLKNVDTSCEIVLTSYSDQIGTLQRNRVLSHQRLSNIENFLKNQGGLQNNFILITKDTPPIGINAALEPQKARTVIITFTNRDTNVSI
ncbi:BON domain-containing protein [Sulfurimonas sp.]|uniref:BON domain-containing protein n=1 Tax=Sulfurimonas sp. TaxID=2022749 RepID=UPI003D0CA632